MPPDEILAAPVEPVAPAPEVTTTPTPETPVESTAPANQQEVAIDPNAITDPTAAIAAETKKAITPYQKRINELKFQKEEANRQAAKTAAEFAAYRASVEASGTAPEPTLENPNPVGPSREAPPVNYQEAIEAGVAQRFAQEKFQTNAGKWLAAGTKDFTDFNDRCNVVASLGAQDRPEFMQLITDPDIVPDGHKVVAALADHPEEAMRIFALPPVQMAAAITKFAMSNSKTPSVPISAAPAPIKTIDGTARATEELTDEKPSADWFAIREKQRAARQGNGRSF